MKAAFEKQRISRKKWITVDAIMFQWEPVQVAERFEEGVGELRLLEDHVQLQRF